jgi:hypothetical protein
MKLIKCLLVIIFFSFFNEGSYALAEHKPSGKLQLQLAVLKSIPFAVALCDFAESSNGDRLCDADTVTSFVFIIDLKNDKKLDSAFVDLAEYYFGESQTMHRDIIINRGYQIIPEIQRRLIHKGINCRQHILNEKTFLNGGRVNASFRCGSSEFADFLGQKLLIDEIIRNRGKPSPHSWPNFPNHYTANDIEAANTLRNRTLVMQLPVLHAALAKSKGVSGWPEWFNISPFIEILENEKHPSMDILLLELRDFSMSADVNASLQRLLLKRMKQSQRMQFLVKEQLNKAPTWLGYMPETLKNIAKHGVIALTQEQRNVELRRLLATFKER